MLGLPCNRPVKSCKYCLLEAAVAATPTFACTMLIHQIGSTIVQVSHLDTALRSDRPGVQGGQQH